MAKQLGWQQRRKAESKLRDNSSNSADTGYIYYDYSFQEAFCKSMIYIYSRQYHVLF